MIQDRALDLDGSVASQDFERDDVGVFDSLERLLWYGIFPRSTVVVSTKNVRVATRNASDLANSYSSLVGSLTLLIFLCEPERSADEDTYHECIVHLDGDAEFPACGP